ncbi:DUF305 domain-containing protein [Spirillospora sp. CA-253888]
MRCHRWTAFLAGCALALAGCGGAERRGFDDDDVMFLQMMVVHHGQGVRIARLAEERAVRDGVRTLAGAIEATQISEIGTMAARLRGWRRPPTAPPGGHAAHGGMPATGEKEIEALEKARGAAFERRFLHVLIAHQDDAVQLARAEAAAGTDPATRELAGRIDRSRTAQIQQMRTLLDHPQPG